MLASKHKLCAPVDANQKRRARSRWRFTRSLVLIVLFMLGSQLSAHAAIKFSIGSDAKTPSERNQERAELGKALKELLKSSQFLKVYGLLKKRCPNAKVRIVYGDSTKHTKASASGGTFVPDWKNPKAKIGKRECLGGTLIVDKAQLKKLRPGHDYKKFLAEVITHELFHAYEDCLDTGYHSEDMARSFGEKAAAELKYATLDETRPPPKPKPAENRRKTKEPESTKTSQAPQTGAPGGQRTALSVPASNGIPVRGGGQAAGAPPGAPGSLFNISAGGFSGQLDRRPTAMLGTELGGVIARANFVYVDNDADVDGFFADATVNTTGLDNRLWGGFGPSVSFETGFRYLHLESDARRRTGRAMLDPGNSLLIFSPQGVGGGLGGGLNAGPRDAVNIMHRNDFDYSQYNLTKQMAVRSGSVTIRPKLRLGYGQTSVDEWFSGQVAGIDEDFAYSNQVDVDSVILGGGLEMELALGQLGSIPVSYFGGVSGAAHFNDQSGRSVLNLTGLVTAQETQLLGGSETTGSFELESGLAFRLADQVELKLGGRYRHFETPGVEILPQSVARIAWQGASETTAYARVSAGFGGPPPGASGAFYASDRRLKRDIAQIATLQNGVRLYRFRYVWDDEFYVGVIAQDLLADDAFRDAVVLMPNGFYAVNYAMIGLKMATFADFRDSSLAAAVLRPTAGRQGPPASLAR